MLSAIDVCALVILCVTVKGITTLIYVVVSRFVYVCIEENSRENHIKSKAADIAHNSEDNINDTAFN